MKTMGIQDLLEERFEKPFQPNILIQPNVGTIEIVLEDVSCYHEWINKEGADISIWRAMDDDRVVGATLPIRKWNGSMDIKTIFLNEQS